MTNLSQRKRIEKLLLQEGEVSRNSALRGDYGEFISRLGALIQFLKDDGWEIEGKYVKKNGGKDYVYTLVSSPLEIKVYYVGGVRVGERIVRREVGITENNYQNSSI